jgi:hypothetical protein
MNNFRRLILKKTMPGFEPRTYGMTERRLRPRSYHGWTHILFLGSKLLFYEFVVSLPSANGVKTDPLPSLYQTRWQSQGANCHLYQQSHSCFGLDTNSQD